MPPSLSYEKSPTAKPIAVVRGGDDDGKVLYLHTEESRSSSTPKPTIKAVRYMSDLKSVKPAERVKMMNKLIEAFTSGKSVDELTDMPPDAKEIYKRIGTDSAANKSVELPDDSTFQAIPDPDPSKRQVWYVAGQSGSGKSYFARGIAENYKKLFPDRDIYLISKLMEDETLDKMKVGKPKRINLDTLVSDPVDLEEFKDCLVIFDDWDTLDKPYFPIVHKLIEDLAIMGRHTNTSMLILSHYLTNYSKTRLILGEAQFLVLYPLATSAKALKYVCEHYGNMDKEDIVKMKRRGRWVLIHKNYPSYVLSCHEANLLHC
jgi:hypothetical protein